MTTLDEEKLHQNIINLQVEVERLTCERNVLESHNDKLNRDIMDLRAEIKQLTRAQKEWDCALSTMTTIAENWGTIVSKLAERAATAELEVERLTREAKEASED